MTAKKHPKKSASQLGQRRKSALEKDKAAYTARRDEIISLAADAFREKGYDATTLSDIAKRAGTDRASVYYYVSSKEELFREVSTGMLERNLAAAEEIAGRGIGAREKLELIIAHHMNTQDQGFSQWSVLVQEMRRITEADTTWTRDVVAKMRSYESIVLSILEEGIEDGTIRGDIPPRLAMNAIFGMLNWTNRWWRPNGKYNAGEVAAAFVAIAFDGLTDGAGPA